MKSNQTYNSRYDRQTRLREIGIAGQEKINQSRVLIVGAGGLGCPVIQYLAGAGTGVLGILDFDRVDLTNLHRQVLYTTADCGKPKAVVAAYRAKEINPEVQCVVHFEKLTAENAIRLFSQYDLIIDATDNYAARYIINDASELCQKPVVYGSIYKHEGQVSVLNYQGGPSYRCLFRNPPQQTVNCNDTGVLGPLCGIVGSYMAGEAIKLCLGMTPALNGKLLLINGITLETFTAAFERNPSSEISAMLPNDMYQGAALCSYDEPGQRQINATQFRDLLDGEMLLLDVRETWEQPHIHAKNVLNIPLDQLEARIHEIPKNKEVVVFCQGGGRSKIAIHQLKHQYGFLNLINLENGVRSL